MPTRNISEQQLHAAGIQLTDSTRLYPALHRPGDAGLPMLSIANQLGQFREVIETAARELAPHMIAFYLKDLAGEFHGWYNAERMLVEDVALKEARIALAVAVRQVIRNGLAILGVSCPLSM